MMRILVIIILSISLSLLVGCQNKEQSQTIGTPEPAVQNMMPTIPQAELEALIQAADEVDIQFLEKGFSMVIPGNEAKGLVATFVPQATEKTPCTETAYFFVKSQGEQIARIGAFYNEGCAYYILYEGNQAKYIGGMNRDGASFLRKFLLGVSTSPQ